MHLVEGNMDAAVSKANFRDRPSSLEYFNAAMDWARTPADIFTISAIVRVVFEPTPGPMGELRRVGAPPAWATQAWVGLQNSMGIPTENMTSNPGAEPGSVNEMAVASSSGLVPNNFVSQNSAPTTLDGGKSVTQPTPAPTAAPTGPITPDTTVQALDASGNTVGSMTADMANNQGYSFAGQGGANDQSTPAPTIAPTPTAGAGQNLKHIWDVEAQDYISLNINDPGSLEQYNWYLGRDGYLGEGEEGFGERDISTFAGAMGGGGGDTAISRQVMDLFREWEAANPGMLLSDMPGFNEASKGGAYGQLAFMQTDANWPDRMDAMIREMETRGDVGDVGDAGEFEDLLSDERITDEQRAWLLDPDRASRLRVGDEEPGEEPGEEPDIDPRIVAARQEWLDAQRAAAPGMDIGDDFDILETDSERIARQQAEARMEMDVFEGTQAPSDFASRLAATTFYGSEPISESEENLIAAQYGQYAIDPLEGGGYGTESNIYSDWLSGMVDVPGEGLMSRSRLNDPNYWEQVGEEWEADPVNARIAQQVRDRQAQIDYATQFPQGQYLDEYPWTHIAGSTPEIAARDLTPASATTFPRPRIFDPELGAYRESTIDDTTISGSPAITGEAMRLRNLGEETALGTVGTPYPVPTPTPEPLDYSFSEPWQSSGAIQAYDPDPWGGGIDFIEDEFVEPEPEPERDFMEVVADIIPFYDPQPVQAAAPAPAPAPIFEPPEDWGGTVYEDPEVMPGRWYDEGARGTRTGDRFTLVGEEGPELALFPRGTEIVPLNRSAKPKQRRRLRNNFADSIDSFAFGGFSNGGPALVGEMGPEVVDLPPGAQVMPAGITEMMTGRPTRQPRSLMRQAGMRAPSAQTISNLLPEEIEVYQEMDRLAGFPEKAFEREFRSMVPMGQGGTRQARFTPRGTGRTRYGNR